MTRGEKKHNPGAFLDLPPEASAYGRARVVVLPMPLEESVSYGSGTRRGPEAIIAASQQVELYDPATDSGTALEYGVHTLAAPKIFSAKTVDAERALAAIAEETEKHLRAGKFVLALGGEHTASLGVARGVAAAGAGAKFTLVHIDAHADLRNMYEENPLSHACVARRIAELPECGDIVQLGIRSTTRDQMDFAETHGIATFFARDMHGKTRWRKELRRLVKGRRVFLTFDVDGLDPSIVPATGTPEPDGLTWRQLLRIAKIVGKHAHAVAMDCVELAPAPGLHYADFTVARALHEMLPLLLRH